MLYEKKEVNLQSIRTVIVLRNRQMAIMNQRIVILLAAVLQWQQALTARITANSEYLQAKTRYLILTGRR